MQQSMQKYLEQIRYQSMLLDNMRDAVVVWGLDGLITYWNAAAELLYGATSADQLGRQVYDIYFPRFDPPLIPPDLQRVGNFQIEHRYQRPDGEKIWISAHITTLFTEGNKHTPIGFMNVSRDITNSKLADQALRQSEARYRAIVEDHQTEMICRFLPDTTLTFVNETYCRYYNRDREQLIGSSFLDPVRAEDKAQVRQTLAGLTTAFTVNNFEQQVRLSDGSFRWQEWVSRAIFDQHNDFIEFQAVGRDITKRKEIEQKLKTAQARLAQSARLASIGELASSVAHQISNPMTTIIAEAQILLQQLQSGHPSRESAEAIIQAGWRAQEVVNELMKFSQPAQSIHEDVEINKTIQNALLLASAHIRASGVQIEVDLTPNLPVMRGNARQLTDLWVNLLLLARSAFVNGADHCITITSRLNDREEIRVEVRDNGIPIPEQEYDTIFEPQLIPTGASRGTGMELSLCREIVRQHHGEISVSGNGQETSFHITFLAKDG